jgi:hypothetical protein
MDGAVCSVLLARPSDSLDLKSLNFEYCFLRAFVAFVVKL